MTDYVLLGVLALQSILLGAALVLVWKRTRKLPRLSRIDVGRALASLAWENGEMLGRDPQTKRDHAVSCFERLDLAADGKRDFSAAEARMYIEAECARRRRKALG